MDLTTLLPVDAGGGVVLHATTEGDAAEAFAVVEAERDRLREWLPWVDSTSDESVEREYLRSVAAANAEGSGLHATMRLDGTFCGFAGLRLKPVVESGEVGYWLSQRCVGRGVMTRAVVAIFELGFTALSLHRLDLLAATGNVRSRAVAERLGMTFEGVRRDGEQLASGWVDLAMYGMLAQDWPGAAVALERAAAWRPETARERHGARGGAGAP